MPRLANPARPRRRRGIITPPVAVHL